MRNAIFSNISAVSWRDVQHWLRE